MKKWQQIKKGFIGLSRRVYWVTLSLFTTISIVFILPFSSYVKAQNAPIANQVSQITCNANFLLANLIIWVLAGTLCVLIIVFGAVIAGLGKKNPYETLQEVFQIFFSRDSNTLQVYTVGAVVFSTVFLALTCQLTEGAIAILSAIVGFVLGSMRSSEQAPKII
ncbi:MAG: hypothetical protein HC769_09650 [Cyanobacteria bacterium CRU_2_1]|nr:hypothetical protein [Cyanobacteria bacterium CRU_2_1]